MARQLKIVADPRDPSETFSMTPKEDWGELMAAKIEDVSTRMDLDARVLGNQSDDIIASEAWTIAGCKSMREFVETKWRIGWDEYRFIIKGLGRIGYENPVKKEQAERLGRTLDAMEAVKQAKTVVQGTRTDLTSLSHNEVKQGTSSSYLLRRMARDYPETLAEYERGKHSSVRQAAIACGIIKEKTPLEKAKAAIKKLSDVEWNELVDWIESVK